MYCGDTKDSPICKLHIRHIKMKQYRQCNHAKCRSPASNSKTIMDLFIVWMTQLLKITLYNEVWKWWWGNQKHYYKDCIKKDLKMMQIDINNWEQLVVHCPAWRVMLQSLLLYFYFILLTLRIIYYNNLSVMVKTILKQVKSKMNLMLC